MALHVALHTGALGEMHVGDGNLPGGRCDMPFHSKTFDSHTFASPHSVLSRLTRQPTSFAGSATW